MRLTDQQAAEIYIAAHSAFQDAARRQSLEADPHHIASNMFAAAGRVAYHRSLKIAKDSEPALLTVQVTETGNQQLEYSLSGERISEASFGRILADLVRFGAEAMRLNEEVVWETVVREHPSGNHRVN